MTPGLWLRKRCEEQAPVCVDSDGEYLNGPDGAGDLAPRDIVSRGMARRMAELGADHCYLDATLLGHNADPGGGISRPSWPPAGSAGLSPDRQWVPVSPTAHYTMGGVLTDAEGRTTLEGLMAVGEVGLQRTARRQPVGFQLAPGRSGDRPASRAAAILADGGPVAPESGGAADRSPHW